MIFYGYLSIIASVFLLIVIAKKMLAKSKKQEYCRKLLHIGTFVAFPLAHTFFGAGSVHFVILCAAFSLVTAFLYFGKLLGHLDNREKRYPGIFYYAIALFLTSLFGYLLPHTAFYFGLGFIGLAFGDGFATLVGSALPSVKIHGEKTLVGFGACFLFTLVPLWVYNYLLAGGLSLWQLLLLSLLTAAVELVDYGLDNLFIPISVYGTAYFLSASERAEVTLWVALGVFAVAFFSRVITYYGSLLAALIGALFYFYGGVAGILFVLGCYAVMLTVSLIGRVLKSDLSSVVKKTKEKDLTEIFVNGFWPLMGLLLLAVTKEQGFYPIALVAMSAGFVDSLASDVGTLSPATPYDPFRKKRVERGVSGGMTVLGTLVSLLGALAFATAITLMERLPLYMICVCGGIAFAGALFDSLLGSLIQVKYRCPVCGAATEREEHCATPTLHVGGLAFVNNDVVNFLSGGFVFLLSFVILFV